MPTSKKTTNNPKKTDKPIINNVIVDPPLLVSGLTIKADNQSKFMIFNFLDLLNNSKENCLLGSYVLPHHILVDIHESISNYLKKIELQTHNTHE